MKKYFSFIFVFVLLGSALFFNNAKAAAPSAINDLTCVKDINAGAIWIRWTPPTGVAAANAYELKYAEGNSIIYMNAFTYVPAGDWASGAVGLEKQELATGFNVGTEFTFEMKVKNDIDEWSAPSNPATCTSPQGPNYDSIAPTTAITFPSYNSIFAVSQGAITIKGTSKDKGGSSVKQIEVSLDNGVTWNLADPVSNDDGNLMWQYIWNSPSVGEHVIKARATDWFNNLETPSTGIVIKVVSEIATPTPTPSSDVSCKNTWWFDNDRRVCSEKQFCGMYMYNGLQTFETRVACQAALDASTSGSTGGTPGNAESLRARIAVLQAQLIQLLNQLIQLLRLK
jgi:hypothetical protein